MESTFGLVDGTPNTSALGNLPLFAKANVLVINDKVLDRLNDTQRSALRTAAEATRDWAITNNPTAATAAVTFCTAEGSIVHADAAEVDAIHQRSKTALDALTGDDAIAPMIDRIRTIVDGVASGPGPAACTPTTPATTQAPTIDVTRLNGTDRFILTADDMRAGSVPESWIERNKFLDSAVVTIALSDGSVIAKDNCQTCTGGQQIDIPGKYTVDGSAVTFRIDDWASHWVMTPTFTDEGITWTYVDSLPPWANAEDKLVDAAFWTTHPWTRVD